MYNVRLFDYPNGAQLRIYSTLVSPSSDEERKEKSDCYIAKTPLLKSMVLFIVFPKKKRSQAMNTVYTLLSLVLLILFIHFHVLIHGIGLLHLLLTPKKLILLIIRIVPKNFLFG